LLEKKIDVLRSQPLDSLLSEAWAIRQKNFKPFLTVSAPGAKTYITDYYKNKKNIFVNLSLTGTNCALNCEHCKRQLLSSMISAQTPEKLKVLGDALKQKECTGVLLSGGATKDGNVPFDGFYDAIKYLKDIGLQVITHTGLVDERTAEQLKKVNIDQALIDVIGDDETIQNVYHLDKTAADFEKSLKILKNSGLNVAPHIVIGLNFGKISGEYNAVRMISEIEPDIIVLVILSPLYNTPMDGVSLPSSAEIARIAAITRIMNPNTPITLGCVRPSGIEKLKTEKFMIQSGVNSITYAMDDTIEFAESMGLKINYNDSCCSLLHIGND